MGEWGDTLLELLQNGGLDPRWKANPLLGDLPKWIAFHDTDRNTLPAYHPGWDDAERIYKADPLAPRISSAFADYLWGEDPTFVSSDGGDQINLDTIVEDNDVPDGFWEGADMQSAEGETYWRICVDPDQQESPIIDWHSRCNTVPLFRGKRLMTVAFVSEIAEHGDNDDCWRYVEIHEEGEVHNYLFREAGLTQSDYTFTGVGDLLPLSESHVTTNLQDDWVHELPMLAGRIPNRLGRDKRLGVSDYQRVEDFLWDLNEAHAVDTENFALTGQKRVVLSESYMESNGNVKKGENVLYKKEGADEMMDGDTTPFQILEYEYDGVSSVARKDDLTATALTRVGLSRQFVDPNSNEGQAASGTALRVRLIPTTLAARGKSRRWDGQTPYILWLSMRVDALPTEDGGFGRSYTNLNDFPTVTRGTILPEDEVELYTRVANAVATGVLSLEKGIQQLHPRWTDDQVKAEAKAIREDQAAAAGFPEPGATGDPTDTSGDNGGDGTDA